MKHRLEIINYSTLAVFYHQLAYMIYHFKNY